MAFCCRSCVNVVSWSIIPTHVIWIDRKAPTPPIHYFYCLLRVIWFCPQDFPPSFQPEWSSAIENQVSQCPRCWWHPLYQARSHLYSLTPSRLCVPLKFLATYTAHPKLHPGYSVVSRPTWSLLNKMFKLFSVSNIQLKCLQAKHWSKIKTFSYHCLAQHVNSS